MFELDINRCGRDEVPFTSSQLDNRQPTKIEVGSRALNTDK